MNKQDFALPDVLGNRGSVSDSIVNLIINHLIQKQLKPGDKLPTESEFVDMLKVGRNSVREAIKMLSSLGVIEIKRGIGTFISEKCSASMFNPLILGLIFEQGTSEELGELRLCFETGLMRIIMEKMTDDDLTNLGRANEQIKTAVMEGTNHKNSLHELDRNFHRVFIGIARNKLLSKIGEIVYVLYRGSVSGMQTSAADPMTIYNNHSLMIKELRKKNLKGLLHLIENFINKDIDRMKNAVTAK